jgi:hypothetical protein
MMNKPHEPGTATRRRPFQHLLVAVGIAEGEYGPPPDETVDADRLARPVIDELDLGSFMSTGTPSGCRTNFVTPEEPTTCSGGMP